MIDDNHESFSERAGDRVKNCKTKVQSWFLDPNLVMRYWGDGTKRAFTHTAPINALYALHKALVSLQEGSLENSWKRHCDLHLALRAGFEAMGLTLIAPDQKLFCE